MIAPDAVGCKRRLGRVGYPISKPLIVEAPRPSRCGPVDGCDRVCLSPEVHQKRCVHKPRWRSKAEPLPCFDSPKDVGEIAVAEPEFLCRPLKGLHQYVGQGCWIGLHRIPARLALCVPQATPHKPRRKGRIRTGRLIRPQHSARRPFNVEIQVESGTPAFRPPTLPNDPDRPHFLQGRPPTTGYRRGERAAVVQAA
jgi:hypothetical protein